MSKVRHLNIVSAYFLAPLQKALQGPPAMRCSSNHLLWATLEAKMGSNAPIRQSSFLPLKAPRSKRYIDSILTSSRKSMNRFKFPLSFNVFHVYLSDKCLFSKTPD